MLRKLIFDNWRSIAAKGAQKWLYVCPVCSKKVLHNKCGAYTFQESQKTNPKLLKCNNCKVIHFHTCIAYGLIFLYYDQGINPLYPKRNIATRTHRNFPEKYDKMFRYITSDEMFPIKKIQPKKTKAVRLMSVHGSIGHLIF